MEKKEKSIKFNLVMNMLLTTSAFVFPLITFPYITRVLLPEGNGKIAFANSVINYFSMFAMLGIPLMEYVPVPRCGMIKSRCQKQPRRSG